MSRECTYQDAQAQMSESVVETERLTLRRYRLGDLDDLAPILGDAETMRFYPAPKTREEARQWIERNLRRYEQDGFGLWAMVLKETGEFAGNCGLVAQVVDEREEVEIAWHVKRSLWGQGLATEAAMACRDHGFAVLGLERIISLIRPANVPSRRVAEKIGMSVETVTIWGGLPHFVYALEHRRPVGPPRDPHRDSGTGGMARG